MEMYLLTLIAPLAIESIDGTQSYHLVVRTQGDPAAAIPSVVGVIRELFPDAPVLEVKTANQVIETALAQERMGARVFSWYALAAGVLVLVGVHGLLAFLVSQTRRDLAIRAALGASHSALARTVGVRVVGPVVGGVFTGVVFAGLLRQVLGTTVIGFSENNVAAELGAAALMIVSCLTVAAAGLRKVWRINPAEALRMD